VTIMIAFSIGTWTAQ